MRDPAPATAELLARAHAAVPGLEGARHLATSVKCTLFSASREGAPVVVKVLVAYDLAAGVAVLTRLGARRGARVDRADGARVTADQRPRAIAPGFTRKGERWRATSARAA